jgi:hypothetical protein
LEEVGGGFLHGLVKILMCTLAGGAIGSEIPVVGTVVGGLVGAGIGVIAAATGK